MKGPEDVWHTIHEVHIRDQEVAVLIGDDALTGYVVGLSDNDFTLRQPGRPDKSIRWGAVLLAEVCEPITRPAWWLRAIGSGKKSPCPICKATGANCRKLPTQTGELLVYLPCYHCRGTGDETAAVRRNRVGQRGKS